MATFDSYLVKTPDGTGIEFESTRDIGGEVTGWQDPLAKGLAKKGGLSVPKEIPSAFDEDFFYETLPQLEMHQVSTLLLRRFIPREDIPDEELLEMMQEAHDFDIPLEEITEVFGDIITSDEPSKIFLAWLDRGPTASFKDIAARAMGKLLNWWCEKNNHPINIIVATSGDTGVAIARAFEGAEWISVTVLYPEGGVSEVQEKQMVQADQANENVQCLAVKGTFDRCQAIAKMLQEIRDGVIERIGESKVLQDIKEGHIKEDLSEDDLEKLKEVKEVNLGSANSINFFRYGPQMTQFFYIYGKAIREGIIQPGEKVVYTVPTGNVGHIMAGITAMEMGAPIKGFVLATNQNDIMAGLINHGVLQHDGVDPSLSPSMDISYASNMERLLDYARRMADPEKIIDHVGIKNAVEDGKKMKKGVDIREFGVTDKMLEFLRDIIVYADGVANDNETAEIMRKVYDKTGGKKMPDSHGAAGVKAIENGLQVENRLRDATIISLVTANPHKFPKANEAAGIEEVPAQYNHPELLSATQGIDVEKQRKDTTKSILEVLESVQKIDFEMAEKRAEAA